MTWKPHWCHHAQQIAAENGWTVVEIAGGSMAFADADSRQSAVDLNEANELARAADKAAIDAITKAASAMPAPDAAEKPTDG